MILFCVGTPSNTKGEADLRPIKTAIENAMKFIPRCLKMKTLVIKSTVPPSATETQLKPLIQKYGFRVGVDIGLANNPEFLREGYAWEDFIRPDRILIGENDKRSGEAVKKIYKPFNTKIFRVSLNTAEFIKHLSNSFLANLISFSNEMSLVADKIGDIDIAGAFKILHLDKRWFGMPARMASYVYPGCGFGGYCLPKDTQAFYMAAKNKGFNSVMLKRIMSLNTQIKKHFVGKIIKKAKNDSYVGVLGLAFKPGSDDVRETAAKDIIQMLVQKNKKIIAYDPLATDNFKKTFKLKIKYARTMEYVLSRCKVIAVLTAWDEFKQKKSLFKNKRVIDGRYFL